MSVAFDPCGICMGRSGVAEHLDKLEAFLEEAPVLHALEPLGGGGGHPSKEVYVLEGGITVLAKMDDGQPISGEMMRAERAAWIVCRALGWTDLVAATVLRKVPYNGAEYEAAVCVVWAQTTVPPEPLGNFPDDDVTRAAIFDTLIEHSDRTGNNWCGTPGDHGERRLKLFDHGYSLGVGSRPFSSEFFTHKQGAALDAEHRGALIRIPAIVEDLKDLVGEPAAQAVAHRASMMLQRDQITR
jgi:hypothetical protein